ncbi:MAG: cytochrome c maturation protein CcmE [Alphaproteobacteria bacterium]|nr:cytochrome c maturation protein CcmE [Alphaproteobacteria bacterium]MCY4609763.1 cytochrome c maturation protein CcmE [bacterium]
MKRKEQRMLFLGALVACFAAAAVLVLVALEDTVTFFHSPSSLAEAPGIAGKEIRLGGLVVEGSVQRSADGLTTTFDLTDGPASTTVIHVGILPDLFREGQGIVARGTQSQATGVFEAVEVLAKHDETYMPPEVAEALKESGYWREDQ